MGRARLGAGCLGHDAGGDAVIGDTALGGLDDKHLTALRRDKVGFIFQAFNLLPTLTALENITLPMDIAGRTPDPAWLDIVIDAARQRLAVVVGGIFEPNQVVGSTLVSLNTHARIGGVPLDRYVYLDLADGTAAADVRPAVETALAGYPVVDVKDQEEFRQEQKARSSNC